MRSKTKFLGVLSLVGVLTLSGCSRAGNTVVQHTEAPVTSAEMTGVTMGTAEEPITEETPEATDTQEPADQSAVLADKQSYLYSRLKQNLCDKFVLPYTGKALLTGLTRTDTTTLNADSLKSALSGLGDSASDDEFSSNFTDGMTKADVETAFNALGLGDKFESFWSTIGATVSSEKVLSGVMHPLYYYKDIASFSDGQVIFYCNSHNMNVIFGRALRSTPWSSTQAYLSDSGWKDFDISTVTQETFSADFGNKAKELGLSVGYSGAKTFDIADKSVAYYLTSTDADYDKKQDKKVDLLGRNDKNEVNLRTYSFKKSELGDFKSLSFSNSLKSCNLWVAPDTTEKGNINSGYAYKVSIDLVGNEFDEDYLKEALNTYTVLVGTLLNLSAADTVAVVSSSIANSNIYDSFKTGIDYVGTSAQLYIIKMK